ncbi:MULTISPECIES: hypothetical protein [Sphingomonadaceae]|nr:MULTISPECIES: hypothetical protein [Sphingomonadaceae]
MATSSELIYFRSRILHGDLFLADSDLSAGTKLSSRWVAACKTALVALGELADLAPALQPLYREYPSLGETVKELASALRFAKYLRNVFAGHINDALIAKTYEWRPELRALPDKRDLTATAILNLFVLETAINTYVTEDGSHGMFESETDLLYPPDMERFLAWLSSTIRSAIQLCDDLGAATHSQVTPLGDGAEMFDAFRAAGLTDFERLKKGR